MKYDSYFIKEQFSKRNKVRKWSLVNLLRHVVSI